jgi:hypothetical protein
MPPTDASCGISTPIASSMNQPPTRLSVMSVIQGDTGVIVIDPLISKEAAVAENAFAGPAMGRAGYMYGAAVAKGPKGQIGAGLGQPQRDASVSEYAPYASRSVNERRPSTASAGFRQTLIPRVPEDFVPRGPHRTMRERRR